MPKHALKRLEKDSESQNYKKMFSIIIDEISIELNDSQRRKLTKRVPFAIKRAKTNKETPLLKA